MNKLDLKVGMTIKIPNAPFTPRYITAVGYRWYLWVDAEGHYDEEVVGDSRDLDMWVPVEGHFVMHGKRGMA